MGTLPSFEKTQSDEKVELAPKDTTTDPVYYDDLSSAVNIELHANTTIIEVSAIDGGVFVRYAEDASSTTGEFSRFVGIGTRHFVLPADVTDISLIAQATGAMAVLTQY